MTAAMLRRARQGKKPPPQVEICIGESHFLYLYLYLSTIIIINLKPSSIVKHLSHFQTTTASAQQGRRARLDTGTALERMMMAASTSWRGHLHLHLDDASQLSENIEQPMCFIIMVNDHHLQGPMHVSFFEVYLSYHDEGYLWCIQGLKDKMRKADFEIIHHQV